VYYLHIGFSSVQNTPMTVANPQNGLALLALQEEKQLIANWSILAIKKSPVSEHAALAARPIT
jgi:hypothetical protein